MQLEVIDNGIGIPSEEINNVMKRFYKVDKSRKHNSSFGIGLSITTVRRYRLRSNNSLPHQPVRRLKWQERAAWHSRRRLPS